MICGTRMTATMLRSSAMPRAPFLQRAGAEIFNENVHLRGEFLEDLDTFRLVQVKRQRFLVSGQSRPAQRFVLVERSHASQRIPFARHLDLDHFRSEVRQQYGSERSGDHRRNVQHFDAFQSRNSQSPLSPLSVQWP